MIWYKLCLGVLLVWGLWACSLPASEATEEVPEQHPTAPITDRGQAGPDTQLLVITTGGWEDFRGELQLFTGRAHHWAKTGDPIPIVTGKNGLGWSVQHREWHKIGGPVKKEGDLKSPAGLFTLGTAFGYAAPAHLAKLHYPYWQVTANTMCIEDTDSRYYNQMIEEGETEQADWNSTDHMLRKDDLYEWGVFVEHNYPAPVAGGGSCIFLHVWNAGRTGTAGCTAMDKEAIRTLLQWLDEEKYQLMVQMPEAVYAQIRQKEGWPEIK